MQEKRSFSSRNAMGSPSSSASLHYLTSILNPQDRPPSILNPQNRPPSVLKILSEGTGGACIVQTHCAVRGSPVVGPWCVGVAVCGAKAPGDRCADHES